MRRPKIDEEKDDDAGADGADAEGPGDEGDGGDGDQHLLSALHAPGAGCLPEKAFGWRVIPVYLVKEGLLFSPKSTRFLGLGWTKAWGRLGERG